MVGNSYGDMPTQESPVHSGSPRLSDRSVPYATLIDGVNEESCVFVLSPSLCPPKKDHNNLSNLLPFFGRQMSTQRFAIIIRDRWFTRSKNSSTALEKELLVFVGGLRNRQLYGP